MKMKAREWKKAWEEVQEFDSSYEPSRFLEPATVLVFFRRSPRLGCANRKA